MSALCIGGCCIPYSALVPLLMLGIRWIATKLAHLGLLPSFVAKRLGIVEIYKSPACHEENTTIQRNIGSKIQSKPQTKKAGHPTISRVSSSEEFQSILSRNKQVVVKFTADWCKPCKKIDPFYTDLAPKYNATFCKIDVDELEDVAMEHGVAIMPTFMVFKGKCVGSVSGANEEKLEDLIRTHVELRD